MGGDGKGNLGTRAPAALALLALLATLFALSPAALDAATTPTPLTCTPLAAKPGTTSTEAKPQSKVWKHANTWWAVFPTNAQGASTSGTWVWRLQGTTWIEVLRLSASTTAKADVRRSGDLAHILLVDGANSQLHTVEYSGGTYWTWGVRPQMTAIDLSAGETATIDLDSTGRLWLATDDEANGQVVVYFSDSPYATWGGTVVLASGVNVDDIAAVIALPGNQVGVFWSNQNTRRFGFRVHADGASPNEWSPDEVPASQSALNVGNGMADDHINLAVAADGTLYAAVKTSYDTVGYPKMALLVRRPNGSWDALYAVDGEGSRGIVALDGANTTLNYFYTEMEGTHAIVLKQSATQPIAFGERTYLTPSDPGFADVSSTKDAFDYDLVVIHAGDPGTVVGGQYCTTLVKRLLLPLVAR